MLRCVSIVVAMAAVAYGCAPAKVTSPPTPSGVGRYMIVHSPEAERDTILLDTATGRTWSRVQVTDVVDEPPAWDPMPQLNSTKDLEALASAHGWKAKGR